MRKNTTIMGIMAAVLASGLLFTGSISASLAEDVRSAVDFDHELDSYTPQKDRYRFYFTYKTVHPWWDAVALGMEGTEAVSGEGDHDYLRIHGAGGSFRCGSDPKTPYSREEGL